MALRGGVTGFCVLFFIGIAIGGCTKGHLDCGVLTDWLISPGSCGSCRTGDKVKFYVQGPVISNRDGPDYTYYCRAEFDEVKPWFEDQYASRVYKCDGSLGEGSDFVIKKSGTDGFGFDRLGGKVPRSYSDYSVWKWFTGVNMRGSASCGGGDYANYIWMDCDDDDDGCKIVANQETDRTNDCDTTTLRDYTKVVNMEYFTDNI